MGMKIRHYLILSLLCCIISAEAEERLPHTLSASEVQINPQMQTKASLQVAEQKGKRCMMVCEEWGEDCVVNPNTGQKDCRRVCVRFGKSVSDRTVNFCSGLNILQRLQFTPVSL